MAGIFEKKRGSLSQHLDSKYLKTSPPPSAYVIGVQAEGEGFRLVDHRHNPKEWS